jgi:uncharacterized protein YjdB
MKTLKHRTFGSRAFSPWAFAGLAAIIVAGLVFTGCKDPDSGSTDGTKTVAVKSVTLNETELDLLVGDQTTLLHSVSPSNATNPAVSWSSSLERVATVSNNGRVTALSDGVTNITVKTQDGGKMATCKITVGSVAVTGVTLNKSTLPLFIGGTEQLNHTVLPTNATVKNVTWTSSDDTKATVNGGLVRGVAEGTVTITVASTSDPSKKAECTVTVSKVAVTSVTLSETTLTMSAEGTARYLTHTVLPANATYKGVTWTSDPPSGTVYLTTLSTGGVRVDAIAKGTATITVTSDDDNTKMATCTVTVGERKPNVPGMVWIEPGTFMMGARDDEIAYNSERPRHQVTLTGFYMTEIGVPQELYEDVMGYNPSFFVPQLSGMLAHWPVDSVTWYDAVEFCIKLTAKKAGLTQVYTMTERVPTDETKYPITSATVTVNWDATGYRLPTEAEWEYACRAGTTTDYNTGNSITSDEANFDYNFGQTFPGGPDPLYPDEPWIIYPPNDWGLYDMHGNVEEWCWDWLQMPYTAGAVTNPRGPTVPPTYPGGDGVLRSYKVARGGSFIDEVEDIRSASRNGWTPGAIYSDPDDPDEDFPYGLPWMGFRVVLPESAGSVVGTSQIRPSLQGDRQTAPSSIRSAVTLTVKRLGVTLKGKLDSIRPLVLKVRRNGIEGAAGER